GARRGGTGPRRPGPPLPARSGERRVRPEPAGGPRGAGGRPRRRAPPPRRPARPRPAPALHRRRGVGGRRGVGPDHRAGRGAEHRAAPGGPRAAHPRHHSGQRHHAAVRHGGRLPARALRRRAGGRPRGGGVTGTGRAGGAAPELTAPLRHGPFRALAAGRTLLYFGNGLATVALAFAVLDATGSVAQLGLVVGARTLANVLLLLAGGVLADRMPRGLLLCGACAVAAGSQGVLAALLLLGAASLPLMIVLAAVNGAAAAANLPAAAALVPQTVPAALLRQANALARIGMEGGRIIGMSFGTLLVALIGPGGAIAADGAAFALAGICFLAVRSAAPGRPSDVAADPLRELAEGWAEFTRRRWVWAVVAQFMVVNAGMSAMVAVLGPAIADASFGRTSWGLM